MALSEEFIQELACQLLSFSTIAGGEEVRWTWDELSPTMASEFKKRADKLATWLEDKGVTEQEGE